MTHKCALKRVSSPPASDVTSGAWESGVKEPRQEQEHERRRARRKELTWKWKGWRNFGNKLEQLETGKEEKMKDACIIDDLQCNNA